MNRVVAATEGPLVSIVLPVRNLEHMLPTTLASLAAQTLRDYELIIVNNASTDGTPALINAAAQQDARIKILNNRDNIGVVASLNLGFAAARGKYIARMDGDDIALPTRLAKQVALMEANPEIVLCGTWGEKFGDDSGLLKMPTQHAALAAALLFVCPFIHPSVMLRGDFVRAHNLRYKDGCKVEDYEIWSRVADLGRVANLPEVLLQYRVHGNSMTAQSNAFRRGYLRPVMRENLLRLLRKRGWQNLLHDGWLDLHGRFACHEKMRLLQLLKLPGWLLLLGLAGNNLAMWRVLLLRTLAYSRTALRGKLLPPAPINDS